MKRRLRSLLLAFPIAVLGALLAAPSAHADGGVVVGMPTAFAYTADNMIVLNCAAQGSASWTNFGGFSTVTFGGRSDCGLPAVTYAEASLYLNGTSSPVALTSASYASPVTNGSVQSGLTVPQNTTLFINYVTRLDAGNLFTWRTFPPHCQGGGRYLTCSMIRPFTTT